MQNAKKFKYSLLFVSDKKAILSYEWYACFDSDCQRLAPVVAGVVELPQTSENDSQKR